MGKLFLALVLTLSTSLAFGQNFEANKIYFKTENWATLELSFSDKKLDVSEQELFFNKLIALYKVQSISKAFKTKGENLENTYLIRFQNAGDVEKIIALLEKQYFTDYAEKIPIYELFLTPNDPQFASQWNLNTIQAEFAWNISTGNTNVVVAITDDAIETTHPDLAANIFVNPNEIPANGIDDDNNGYIDDVNGWDAADNDNNPNPVNNSNDHGTHVAGISAAASNNNVEIASIGFNVKIMPVKIGTSPSGSLIGSFDGLDYAINSGYADVINMSWGGTQYSATMQNLLTAAFNANIVCVAAAGNSNTTAPSYPAAYNNVISVGATNISDVRASFSNYGTSIDVMAPGHTILSTVTNSAYDTKSGTSMASPLVAGLCALMISNTPGITPTQVETCLKASCDNIDAQNPTITTLIGAGRINAFQSMQCFNTPPTANFSVNFQNVCQNQSLQFSDMSYGTTITSWLWDFGDGNSSTLQNPNHIYTTAGPFTVSLTVTNAYGTDTKTEINYINTSTPTAALSGSSNIVSGGNAYLQVQFTGNAPFDFVYTDGTTNFSETGITANPYYFSVSPTANTTYSLVSVTDAGCGGTVSGSAAVNIFSTNISNNALDFDGIDDYINIDPIQTEMSNTSAFTIEFWVKIDGQNAANYGTFFAANSATGANKIVIFYDSPTGVAKVLNTNSSNIYLTGTSDIGDNVCHHIAYVYDNDSTFLYVDGMLEASNLSSLTLNNTDKYSIGQEYDNNLSTSDFYEDKIDDIRIWNYRRTNTEILSNKNIELSGNESGLIAYYDLNQGVSGANNVGIATIEDRTPNMYDGAINNLALTGNTSNFIEIDCINLNNQNNSCTNGQYIIRGNQDEEYSGIIELQNGDFLFVGSSESYGAGNSDLLIIRYTPNFNIVWQKTFGGTGIETIISSKGIVENTNGSVTIRATTSSYGAGNIDFLLFNINATNGSVNWSKTYGGSNEERGYGFEKTQDGGYLLSGDTKSFTGSNRKLYLVKTDALGNLLWTKIIGNNSANATAITYVLELSNQQILISGSTTVPSSSSSFISKLDAQGNLLWTKIYGQTGGGLTGQEAINGLIQKPNGNIIATGMTRNFETLGGTYDALVMEIDSANGNVVWSNVYGGSDIDFSYHSVVDLDGNYIIPFYQKSFGLGDYDMSLVKIDGSGNLIQSKSFGSSAYEMGRSINVCSDGGLISTYFTEGFGAVGRDAVIARTDAGWNTGCNEMDVPIASHSVSISPQNYTFSTNTGGTEQTISINNLVSNIVMDTLCSAPCDTTNTNTSCANGQFMINDNGQTEAQSIAYTDDGGYVIAGYTDVSGAGQEDVFVTKFDSQNNIEWSNTYGTSSAEKGYALSICITQNGYALTFNSSAYAPTLGATVVMKLDLFGNIIWQKKIDNAATYIHGRYIFEDSNENLIVTGTNTVNSFGADDMYLLKLSSSGNLLWSTTFGTNSNDHSIFSIENPDGSYYYGNSVNISGSTSLKSLIKVSNSGAFLWSKKFVYDNTAIEQFADIKHDSFNNTFLIGRSNNKIILTKIDSNANHIWSKEYSKPADNATVVTTLFLSSTDEIYFSGQSNIDGNGNMDFFLTKTDQNGNEIWTKFYGGNLNETYYNSAKALSINETENKIYLFSNTESFGGIDTDPYIVIGDLEGNSDCNVITSNWLVSNISPTTSNITGNVGNMGTMSNSSLVSNPFLSTLDTICTTVCDTAPIVLCENNLYQDTICQGDSTQITLPNGTDFNWTPNYNISNNNTANPVLFPAVDTTYIVTYYNVDSCFIIDTVKISVNTIPIITTNISDTTICPSNCVALNAQGGISFVWTPGIGLNNSNIQNPIACPSATTQYIVTGTDSNGCSAEDTLNINVLACCGAFADFGVSDSIICVGESISVSNQSVINPPATHSWTFTGAVPLSSNLENPTTIAYNIPGVYEIQYILSDACGTDTITKTIYVNDFPYVETANDTLLCDSAILVYDIGGIDISDYDYLWTPSTGLNFDDIANPTASISSSEQYIVTVTDNFTSCTKMDTVNITFLNLPSTFIQSNSSSFCENDTIRLQSNFAFDSIVWNGNVNDTVLQFPITNDSLIWATAYIGECFVMDTFLVTADSIPNFLFVSNDTSICFGESLALDASSSFPIEWNTTETTNSINVSPISDSVFFVTAVNGNCSFSDSVLIVVNSFPTINILENDTGICLGNHLFLNAISDSPFTWSSLDTTNQINVSPTNDSLFYVVATNLNCTRSDSIMVSVDTIPDLDIITNDTSICFGESLALEASSSFPIEWNTTETTNSINVSPISDSDFIIQATNGYCTANDSVQISVLALPNINIAGNDTACINSTINLTASGATHYTWTNADNTTGTNNTLTLISDTTVFVTGTSLCSNSDSINLFSIDSNQINIFADDTVCEGVTINLTAISNTSIVWNNNEITNTISAQLFSNTSFTASSSSAYCPAASDSIEIIVIPLPNLSVSPTIEAVQGQLINLDASGGANYIWSPSDGLSCLTCASPSFEANESMVYYVSTEAFGCTVLDSVEVFVSPLDQCIAIPTGFSPNGDGVNDEFFPILKTNTVEIQEFRVYNRWGEEVHNGKYAWDGKYKNEEQALETYVYFVKYTCNNEAKQLVGNVSLIK